MKMDIACPVELLGFEQIAFGEERKQGYFTFLNESMHAITALSGRVLLYDTAGEIIADQRVSFGQIDAPPQNRFTCHLPLDDYAATTTATMIVEDVLFDGEEPWALHPTRLKEYAPPVQAEGEAKNALIAAAGSDAICFPQREGNLWLCVCGRYNRWRWTTCRRCKRDRDQTLNTLSKERVDAAYQARISRIQTMPLPAKPPARQASKGHRARTIGKLHGRQRWIALLLGGIVLIAAIVGIVALARRLPDRPMTDPDVLQYTQPTATPAIDYLEPLK